MTKFENFINSQFTYEKKAENGAKTQHTTTLVECTFSRLPKNAELTKTEIGVALANLYNAVCYLAVQKSDGQRNKYANKVKESIKAWFALSDIPCNDGNMSAFHMVCGIKKSTSKGETNSALPSKSTFYKNVLFCTYKFKTEGAWVSKDPLAKSKKDEHAELWAQMEENKKAYEAQKAQNEAMYTFIMADPKLKAAFEAMSKNA